ncbi:hypothetical protein B9J78_02700 [bacterium Unc6]|nr:hypothetical protein [bacterium Unc6]
MRYEYWISYRYLKAKRLEKFVSLISVFSIFGVAIGVMALIVVIGVMRGFSTELKRKIIGMNASIVVEKQGGIEDYEKILEKIKTIKDVKAASPYIIGQAMVRSKNKVLGCILKGINIDTEIEVTKIKDYLKHGTLYLSSWNVIIGEQMASVLGVTVGDHITIISPADGSEYDVKVRGIFSSGMYEYDIGIMFIDIKDAQEFFITGNTVSGISIKVGDIYRAGKVKTEIEHRLGFPYYARTWIESNKALFSALRLERITMFIILTLMIVVACFGILSTLIMTVMEKVRDIGILKAIGAANASIKLIFTSYGLFIGTIGTALGSLSGIGMCLLIKTTNIIKLPGDIYYFEKLPVQMTFQDIFLIIVCALMISFLATLYPAHQAARLNPVETLRYE